MGVFHLIKKNSYFDSVTLMLISGEIKKLEGVEHAVVGMGTDYNIDSLKRLGMFSEVFSGVTPNDLIICVTAATEAVAAAAIESAQKLLQTRKTPATEGGSYAPSTQEGAFRQLPEANMVVISVPGAFAAREARLALEKGKHVMLFSDNVSLEEELALKELACAKGLLMMGPDCGTAIINQTPLAFANVVRKGAIGLVAASGTGLQEVTSIIHRLGYGISQAIGVGGRDLSEKIAGRMTRLAVKALADDPQTRVITLISKPPADKTLELLWPQLREIKKPIVIYFIGADPERIKKEGFTAAATLEDAAVLSCGLLSGNVLSPLMSESELSKRAAAVNVSGKYLRGLYSGGTLCDEAQRLLTGLGEIYSNTPIKGCLPIRDVYRSEKHTILDLGDDDFTRGKAHPMIDPSLRQERIVAEAGDPETGVIAFDVVLGYGSHPDMATEMALAVGKAKKAAKHDIVFAATVCGTEDDPQNYRRQVATLESAGVHVFPSNVALVKFLQKCLGGK
jgi:succinyl-CoA synthetase alpha subunit